MAFHGRGNRGKDLWDAYNGVTEYITWEAGQSTDSRMRSLWLGDGADVNRRALEVGVEMAMARA